MPLANRILGPVDYGVLWFSLGVGLLVLAAGALLTAPPEALGLGLPLSQALVAIAVGSIAGSALLGVSGLPGSRGGIPTMVTLRPVLGARGSYIPSGLNVLQLLGWTGFELFIMAHAASQATGPFLGAATPLPFLLLFAIWCTVLALGGPLVVLRQWLERFGIWLVVASSLWITWRLVDNPVVASALAQPWRGDVPMALALDIVIAMPISWWPLISDYSRFARRRQGAAVGTIIGYTLANAWFYGLGAALVFVSPAGDPIAGIVAVAFGAFALLPILVDETDNAFANIYSSAVSVQNIAPRASQGRLILAVGAVGTALALYFVAVGPIASWGYSHFLLLIGALFVPLLGILISHQLLPGRTAGAPSTRGAGFIAWGLGIATYFGFYIAYPTVGSTLPSFLVALGVHQALTRLVAAPGSRREKGTAAEP